MFQTTNYFFHEIQKNKKTKQRTNFMYFITKHISHLSIHNQIIQDLSFIEKTSIKRISCVGVRFCSTVNGCATCSSVEQKLRNHLMNSEIPNIFRGKYIWKPRGN